MSKNAAIGLNFHVTPKEQCRIIKDDILKSIPVDFQDCEEEVRGTNKTLKSLVLETVYQRDSYCYYKLHNLIVRQIDADIAVKVAKCLVNGLIDSNPKPEVWNMAKEFIR